ncbi:MAG: MFS transporter [Candidatus Bathyarchaeota archaeon]
MGSKSQIELFGLRKNALVITTTSFILGIGRLMVSTFFNQYALYLGAPVLVLGLFSTIQGLVRVLLAAPLGYLGDRIGKHRRWIMIAGDAFSALAYFLYILANNWVLLIPGLICESAWPVTAPVKSAIVSDSINPEKRGMALATRALTIGLPGTFAPFFGGVLLDSLGLAQGMPVLLIIAGLFRVGGTVCEILFVKEDKEQFRKTIQTSQEVGSGGRIKEAVSDMFGPFIANRTLQTMAIISFAGYIGVSVVNRLQSVYVTNIIGLTMTEWGLVIGVGTTVGALIRIPLGKLTDIIGRKKCILIDYSVRPIYFLGFTLATGFTPVLLLNVLNNFSGETGSPAWQALLIDSTPRGTRGRVHGVFTMVSAVSESIFPSLTVFLWATYGPNWAFYLPGLIDTLLLVTIYLFLKEPKQREK